MNPWRVIKMVVPARLQYAVKDRLPRSWQDRLLFLWYAGGGSYRNRRAFAVPNNEVVGAIRISLKGRDFGGVVEPGAEYARLLDEIETALGELRDPETGRSVVHRVTRLHELCEGPFVHQLPDLTVLWEADFPWSAVESPRFGRLDIRPMDARSGSHTERSFLIAAGPGAARGARLSPGCSTLDVPATIFETAGVEIPGHFDGRPIPLGAPTASQRP